MGGLNGYVLMALLLTLVAGLSGMRPAGADEPVLGPLVYERLPGKPVLESEAFSIAQPAPEYRLQVHNGGVEGIATGAPVSAGEVLVNGVEGESRPLPTADG